MPGRPTCAKTTCINPATERVAAADTKRQVEVCGDDIRWAKQQLTQDHPGLTITRERISAHEVDSYTCFDGTEGDVLYGHDYDIDCY